MSSKQRNVRKRRVEEDENGDDSAAEQLHKDNLQDIKLIQKQRKRLAGIDATTFTATPAGTAVDDPATAVDDDGNELMETYVKEQAANNVLDEEAHMQQFIQKELAKRLGKRIDSDEQQLSKQELEDQELYRVPDGLKVDITRWHALRL